MIALTRDRSWSYRYDASYVATRETR